jgi:hypothetical protein
MSGNCADRLWLTDKALTATKDWFVRAHKINKPDDLDTSKRFTDGPYQFAFAVFLEFCTGLAGKDDGTPDPLDGIGAVNKVLAQEGCAQRLLLDAAWRQRHRNDVIDDCIAAMVTVIKGHAGAGGIAS